MNLPYVALFFAARIGDQLVDYAGDIYSDLAEIDREDRCGAFSNCTRAERAKLNKQMDDMEVQLEHISALNDRWTEVVSNDRGYCRHGRFNYIWN
jgi:hypothetical protein